MKKLILILIVLFNITCLSKNIDELIPKTKEFYRYSDELKYELYFLDKNKILTTENLILLKDKYIKILKDRMSNKEYFYDVDLYKKAFEEDEKLWNEYYKNQEKIIKTMFNCRVGNIYHNDYPEYILEEILKDRIYLITKYCDSFN